MSTVAETIRRKLEKRFTPLVLSVIDDSARHAGHAGASPKGESHFNVIVVSEAFVGLNRVARHRLVYETLGGEFGGGLHALAISALTPEEAAKED